MNKNKKICMIVLTLFLVSGINTYAVVMKKGKIGIGWGGYPIVRYWLGPKLGIELGADFNLQTTTAKNAVNTNSFFLSGKFLKTLFDSGDLNINFGLGMNINAVSNVGGVDGAGQTDIDLYSLLDFEYFLKNIPNLSFGGSIGFVITPSIYKPPKGDTVITTRTDFFANGFSLGTIAIRYYFY
jgi:hypothetical protein